MLITEACVPWPSGPGGVFFSIGRRTFQVTYEEVFAALWPSGEEGVEAVHSDAGVAQRLIPTPRHLGHKINRPFDELEIIILSFEEWSLATTVPRVPRW